MTKPDLGKFGVFGHHSMWQQLTPEQLQDIEALGYGAIWAGGSPPAELDWVDPILGATDNAAGGHRHRQHLDRRGRARRASPSTASTRPIPGRFLLGIGVGHPEATPGVQEAATTRSPTTSTSSTSTACRRTVAWSPRSARRCSSCRPRRSAGAHPYLTTPEHTAQARELIGPDAFLAPEHKVVLTTDAEKARAVGRKALEIYLNLTNYRTTGSGSGFTDEDVAKPGSDALVDAVVAYGTVDAIAARLKEHLAAGADHVPVQVLTGT